MKHRPRFSVRTLAIFVTLVCAYFGAWEATKKWGLREFEESPLPLIIRGHELITVGDFGGFRATYNVWLFGPKIKLPFLSKNLTQYEKDERPRILVWGDRLGYMELTLWVLIGLGTLALWLLK